MPSLGDIEFAARRDSGSVSFVGDGYVPFETADGPAWFGEHVSDPAWDAFLQSVPAGEYQQSSMWAHVKAAEGWQTARVVIVERASICGGFQILWKKTRVGRIGYVARGPVLSDPRPAQAARITSLLRKAAARLNLRAMVAQCPAEGNELDAALARGGFLPNRFMRIVSATWLTPVAEGMERVEARMRRTTRRTLRVAVRNGVTVREGDQNDIALFFDLMRQSAIRQGGSPNPASESILVEVWKAFRRGSGCRLTFAMHEGRPISGLLCLCFRNVVHVWKKGSLPESLPLHPMEVLYHDALAWAGRMGYESADFEAMSRGTAESLLSNRPITEAIAGSRDFYNMGFGGHPLLQNEARLYFRNPLISSSYRLFACSKWGTRLLRNRYTC